MYAFCFFISKYCGGAERRLARVFNLLAQRRYQFDLVVVGDAQLVRKFVGDNLPDKYLNIIVCRHVFDAIRVVLKNRYKVICYYDACFRLLLVLLASMLVGTRRMLTIASIKFAKLEFSNLKSRVLFELTLRISDHVDVLYPSRVELLKERYPSKTFTVTPNSFTNLNEFRPGNKENIISFVSRLVSDKNAYLFLESISLCQDCIRDSGYRVYLCGNGPEYGLLLKYVERNRLGDIVHFKGYVNPKSVLPFSRVFLSLQTDDNYPSQSLLEAIASGCYIIASDKGDTNLIVKDAFGSLVDLDPCSISHAIVGYINMSEQSKQNVIESSRRFAVENFCVSTSYEYFKNIIPALGDK